jgi:hypothetical protein
MCFGKVYLRQEDLDRLRAKESADQEKEPKKKAAQDEIPMTTRVQEEQRRRHEEIFGKDLFSGL